jgi:caffeoyl-CoA O-methyltransferase
MELMNILAEAYAEKHTSPEDALLQQISADTAAHHKHAHMLSGHLQGKVLEFISCMLQPTYILEIGTFTGYSALCLAKGLQQDGELHTIELREEDANRCAKNFSKSALHKKIHLHVGNALNIIPTLDHKWDLVFIDADKTGYIAYYEMLLPRLNENGLIIADNVLFHGQVLTDNISGKNAIAIDAFNTHVAADKRTEQVMLTVRDGLLLIKKKK